MRKELEPKPWSGCSSALPSLREAFDDDLVPRALADARGTRPAASATVRHALDSVQHRFAARRVHRRREAGLAHAAWHTLMQDSGLFVGTRRARGSPCKPAASSSFRYVSDGTTSTATPSELLTSNDDEPSVDDGRIEAGGALGG